MDDIGADHACKGVSEEACRAGEQYVDKYLEHPTALMRLGHSTGRI